MFSSESNGRCVLAKVTLSHIVYQMEIGNTTKIGIIPIANVRSFN